MLQLKVSLPYEFTLFSNVYVVMSMLFDVSLPYEFTLFSNKKYGFHSVQKFHYLMNLHYSQTAVEEAAENYKFHYLMNLHYSQTVFGM